MQPYLSFALAHWELCLAFVIVLILLISLELRNKLSGLPQIAPSEAVLLINRDQAIVVDIRDNAQFSKGHVLGAINIPANDLEQKIKQLGAHKNKTIILINSPGQPLGKIGAVLQNNGFSSIRNLSGGINAWLDANLPLVKSSR